MMLYAHSRALPATLAALAVGALLAAWCAEWLAGSSFLGPGAPLPVTALAPLAVSAAIGVSLHQHSPELDRTAVRPWVALRSAQLLALTALAAALLALAARERPDELGAAVMVRNVVGATGVTAGAAVVLGARLSWLPMLAWAGAALLTVGRWPVGGSAVWAWLAQPGPQTAAWWTAGAAFVLGWVLYALRGAAEPRRW
ncbi:hypothetical protein [Streptomyces gobiensis]|uniref:hypothetical protein n=1 Tax=Streptomyces gobiensis TaxID=2875706 RepID=UPI001E491645|nr:hypothetical protein [Streptomyces gobiensis]UGY93606.1 hypothetical protein test1122_19025 [Streptomyces gobiensis]